MTRSSKADARMMNFLASPPERDVWSIASTTPEDLTYYAETGQLDFKSGKMVASGVAPIPPSRSPRVYLRSGARNMPELANAIYSSLNPWTGSRKPAYWTTIVGLATLRV